MKDPAFEKTRQYLPTFGSASRIASVIHKQLSIAQKRKVRNSKLIKEILPLIKEKWSAKKIMNYMKQRYGIALKGFKSLRSFIHNVRTASLYYNKPVQTVNPPLTPGLDSPQRKPVNLLAIPPVVPDLVEWGSRLLQNEVLQVA